MMRKAMLILLLVGTTGIAQIKGNKDIQTKTFAIPDLTDIEIGLYADVIIDLSEKELMEITADSNLFDLIDTEVVDGTLKLNQKKRIESSQRIKIRVGAPKLRRLQQGTNDVVHILNLDAENFNTMALNGEIVISGKVNTLGVGAENGTVDAGKVKAKEVNLNIWGHGNAIVFASEVLNAELSTSARLILVNQPKTIKGNIAKALANGNPVRKEVVRYISFKIKNNSLNRNNFYVIGPKPDGKNFSYGFPMMPGKTRKEKWTTGTKIYKVNRIGLRKLLVTITDKDEDKVVKLF